jgi:integrase
MLKLFFVKTMNSYSIYIINTEMNAMVDPLIDDYLNNLAGQNPRSAISVSYYLKDFQQFIAARLQIPNLTILIAEIKSGQHDVYTILRNYASELITSKYQRGQNTARTINYKVKYAKRLLEYHDVDITQSKFRTKVKIPRNVDSELTSLDKETVRKILNACDDIRLKTFVLWLASSGWRAKESLALKLENFNFDTNPVTVSIHERHIKTRKSRHTWLTQEFARQLDDYLNWKYRSRRINTYRRGYGGEYVTKLLVPVRRLDDYVFLIYHDDLMKENPRKLEYGYNQLNKRFNAVIKRLKIGKEIDSKQSRVTFHSFRRFAYTQLDSLGLGQFAEFYVGHEVSEYWNKSEAEKIATFKKVESYLMYNDVATLEAKGADHETRIDVLQSENVKLKRNLESLYKQLYAQGIIKREPSA